MAKANSLHLRCRQAGRLCRMLTGMVLLSKVMEKSFFIARPREVRMPSGPCSAASWLTSNALRRQFVAGKPLRSSCRSAERGSRKGQPHSRAHEGAGSKRCNGALQSRPCPAAPARMHAWTGSAGPRWHLASAEPCGPGQARSFGPPGSWQCSADTQQAAIPAQALACDSLHARAAPGGRRAGAPHPSGSWW